MLVENMEIKERQGLECGEERMKLRISGRTPTQPAWVSVGIFEQTSISLVIASPFPISATRDCYVRLVFEWGGRGQQR